jgi:hypothetical protein
VTVITLPLTVAHDATTLSRSSWYTLASGSPERHPDPAGLVTGGRAVVTGGTVELAGVGGVSDAGVVEGTSGVDAIGQAALLVPAGRQPAVARAARASAARTALAGFSTVVAPRQIAQPASVPAGRDSVTYTQKGLC